MYRQRYSEYPSTKDWMPACAGMTDLMNAQRREIFAISARNVCNERAVHIDQTRQHL
jgi:hypothetical protein